jgi:membrane protease YdiL (CAAX protease family)
VERSGPSAGRNETRRFTTPRIGRRLLLALGFWLLTSIIIGTATVFAVGTADATPLVVAEVYILLIAAVAFVFRADTAETLGLVPCRPGDVVLAVVACASAYGITAGVQSVVGPWPWSDSIAILKAIGSDDGRLVTASPMAAAVIIVRATLLAAVGEELLFRGVLYTWLRQRLSAGVAIPISAAAFALIHGFPPILPLAFVIGIGFAWVRERSGSIVPTIAAHALNNAVLIVWAYYATGWTARLPAWGAS